MSVPLMTTPLFVLCGKSVTIKYVVVRGKIFKINNIRINRETVFVQIV